MCSSDRKKKKSHSDANISGKTEKRDEIWRINGGLADNEFQFFS